MKSMIAVSLVAAASACASAGTVGFAVYTDNTANGNEIATSATLAADNTTFSITIANNSSRGFIGSFYMESGAALSGVDPTVQIGNVQGVDFMLANGNWNGPGGTTWSDSFLEITKNGAAENGIDPGETLTLTFNHNGSFSLSNFIDAVNAQSIRFAIHYQDWTDGKSEKLLSTTVVVVPLPPAAWAGLAILAGLGGLRTVKRRQR